MYINNAYYIFTPNNHYYRVGNPNNVARILAQIAQAQHPLRRAATALTQFGIVSTLGASIGAVSGAPFAAAALLAGAPPLTVFQLYTTWVGMVAAVFTFEQVHLLDADTIEDNLSP